MRILDKASIHLVDERRKKRNLRHHSDSKDRAAQEISQEEETILAHGVQERTA